MNKLAYYKMMGLRKRAAKIPLSPLLQALSRNFYNLSSLHRKALLGTSAQQLTGILKGFSPSLVDMSPFLYNLSKKGLSQADIQRIARDAFQEARISFSHFAPREINSFKTPGQLFGHIFNFKGKPTAVFDYDKVPTISYMQSHRLLPTLHAAMQNRWGSALKMPTNKADLVSRYYAYLRHPRTNFQAWKDIVRKYKLGEILDYRDTNSRVGNIYRFSDHLNSGDVGRFTNIVAEHKGMPFYDLQDSFDTMKNFNLLPKELDVVIQPDIKKGQAWLLRTLTDNLGSKQGLERYQRLLRGQGKGILDIILPGI